MSASTALGVTTLNDGVVCGSASADVIPGARGDDMLRRARTS
jgi:hypothetical protein